MKYFSSNVLILFFYFNFGRDGFYRWGCSKNLSVKILVEGSLVDDTRKFSLRWMLKAVLAIVQPNKSKRNRSLVRLKEENGLRYL